ncbi:hypothetical protein KIW84_011951 [Lathyrus oleraceus]|uniref:Retroviral polymerase SH3-like domain-containing protein n=1 Tax=Pisum sativum TaxID=3888 RepID=A0A9D5BGA3_PEA|nr:hypothetical protein KIW84_011951 [Pisum sativum]
MLGYSERSKGYRVYNTETKIVEESIHVRFDDKLDPEKSKLVEKFADLEITLVESDKTPEATVTQNSEEIKSPEIPKKVKSRINISEDLILGNKDEPHFRITTGWQLCKKN